MLEAGRGERQPSPRPSGVGSVSISAAGAEGTSPIIAVLGGGFEGKATTGRYRGETVALLELIGALCLTSLGPRVSATQD